MEPVTLILFFLFIFLLGLGIKEHYQHRIALSSIPVRVHINGSRGKSSVTRLIAAGLRAGGKRTIAKTTGSAPRIIDMDGNDKVIHRLRSASIGEQIRLLKSFAKQKPDVVVMECMAVQPQYQWIAEHKIVKSTVGVITNVRPDHIDEMGPRMSDIAYSLSNTVPYNGIIVTAEHENKNEITEIAKFRKSKIFEVHAEEISKEFINRFPFLEHEENVALSLKVCELIGVDRESAMEGMVHARPDPGALVLWKLNYNNNHNRFVNAFAANDPQSTLKIWCLVDERLVDESVCVFLNTRPDRRQRTKQMLKIVADEIQPDYLVVRGDNLPHSFNESLAQTNTKIKIFPYSASVQTVSEFLGNLNNYFIFGIGNMVGWGESLVSELKRYRVDE